MSKRTRPRSRPQGPPRQEPPIPLTTLISPTSGVASRLTPQTRFLLFRLLPFLVMAGMLLFLLATSAGAEGPIQVRSTDVENRWPKEMAFKIAASSDADITEINVRLQVGSGGSSQIGKVEFDKGRSVQGEYVMKTRGTSYTPPGTDIEYAYEIVDAAGNRLTTPKAKLMYLDPRFTWSSLKASSKPITAWYYGNGERAAQASLKAVEQAALKMEQQAGMDVNHPFKLIIYGSREHWRDAQNTRSETQERELILLGTAHGDHDLVLVLGDPTLGDPSDTAAHEATHLFVRWTAGNLVPAWLNEGLAVYGQAEVDRSYLSFLENAIKQDRSPPLRGLASLPGRPADNIAGYGQSYSVVKYLIDTHGSQKMGGLLGALNQGQAIDEALKSVYGFDQDGLDAKWRESIGAPPRQYDFSAPTPIAMPTLAPLTLPQSSGSSSGSATQPGGGQAAAVPASNPGGAFMLLGVGLIGLSLLAAAGMAATKLLRRG